MSALDSPLAHLAQLLAALTPGDIVAVAIAFLLMRLARHAGMWVYAVVALPGTALHELAHFTLALVLGARPSFPSLIPQRTPRGWRLGEVRFHAGRLRAMCIALAPLLLAPLALLWALVFLAPGEWPWYALHVWIVAASLQACLPSRTDWRIAMPAFLALVCVVLGAVAAWYFWPR